MKGVFELVSLMLVVLSASGTCGDSLVEFEFPMTSGAALRLGQDKINELLRHANIPSEGGNCWKSALEFLETGCKLMNEETQRRMAFRFTSCFNEMMGLKTYICEASTSIQDCTKQLDASDISTFRDYFLHTQDMCYYLRQESWQKQANVLITGLQEATFEATVQMVEQKKVQESMYESQQESLKIQSNMKKDNEDLMVAVVRVKDVFNDFAETAKEHQLISTEIFEKLILMQELVAWIQGEMSMLDAIIFYFAAVVFGGLATLSTRTHGARYWLILLFMVAAYAERYVYMSLTQNSYTPEEVKSCRWVVRKIAVVIACIIVVVEGARYRDMQSVNNHMLTNMNITLEKLSSALFENPMKLTTSTNQTGLEQISQQQAIEDSSDDSFSNYSSDESEDNLEHELKSLVEEDRENHENRPSAGFPSLMTGRFFGREANENVLTGNSRALHSYNLRERSSTPCENPIVQQESPSEFARALKKKASKTTTRLHYFSSDDEF